MNLHTELLPETDGFPEHSILFDIETTGLSAATSYIYLIGAIYRKESHLYLTQWFCDSYQEEKELLSAFRSFLTDHANSMLVHYNGTTFDLPFLNKKWERHRLSFFVSPEDTQDLYQLLLPFRRLTQLPDLKQKTVEASGGYLRDDSFQGGDLIEVYAAYTGKYRLATLTGDFSEADALRTVLLLHNHDDLLGLLKIYQLTHLPDIRQGKYLPELTLTETELLFSYPVSALPFAVTKDLGFASWYADQKGLLLRIPLFLGELKYFFPDYKNYSYLIYEDTAIHNSLADYVDPEAKKRCTPRTAYQRKNGLFLPLPPKFSSLPAGSLCFFREYRQQPAYLELSRELLADAGFVNAYVSAILSLR